MSLPSPHTSSSTTTSHGHTTHRPGVRGAAQRLAQAEAGGRRAAGGHGNARGSAQGATLYRSTPRGESRVRCHWHGSSRGRGDYDDDD
eukprot:1332974-Rhodomonas_salina.1